MKPVLQRAKERNEKERSKVEVIEEYLDLEKGCMVKVFPSPEPLPWTSIPVGYMKEEM